MTSGTTVPQIEVTRHGQAALWLGLAVAAPVNPDTHHQDTKEDTATDISHVSMTNIFNTLKAL